MSYRKEIRGRRGIGREISPLVLNGGTRFGTQYWPITQWMERRLLSKAPFANSRKQRHFRTPPLSFCKGKLIRLLPDLSLYHQSPLYKNIQSFPWAGLIHGERLPLGRVAGRKRQAPILQGKKCYVLVQARPIGARN